MKYGLQILISLTLFGMNGYSQKIDSLDIYQKYNNLSRAQKFQLAEEYFNNGKQLAEKEEYPDALIYLDEAIRLRPDYNMAYYQCAMICERLIDYDRALYYYEFTLHLKPDFSEALFNRARVHFKNEDYKNAIIDFRELLKLPPTETEAIYFKGIKHSKNDPDTEFKEIISLYDKEAEILGYIGLCQHKLKDYGASLESYNKAILKSRDDDNLYVNRGLVYIDITALDHAIEDFKTALFINPDNSLAQMNLTNINTPDNETRIDQLSIVINNNAIPEAYANRAYYKHLERDYTGAISDYDSAIILDPDDATLILNRGMSYEKLHDLSSALNDYEKSYCLDPNNPKSLSQLGNIYFKLEDYKKSIDYYTKSLDQNPDQVNIYFNRGLAYHNMTDIESACEDMKKAHARGADNSIRYIKKNCDVN